MVMIKYYLHRKWARVTKIWKVYSWKALTRTEYLTLPTQYQLLNYLYILVRLRQAADGVRFTGKFLIPGRYYSSNATVDNTVAYDEAVTPNSQNPLVTTYMNLPPAPQVLDDVWTSLLITLYLLLYARILVILMLTIHI